MAPLVPNTNPLPYDVIKFKIFVNEKESFLSNFEVLETSWKGTDKDITKAAVDKEDPYFASVLAACIISHVGGISRKHLIESEKIPKVVTSIARYYVYYHMKRFLYLRMQIYFYRLRAVSVSVTVTVSVTFSL